MKSFLIAGWLATVGAPLGDFTRVYDHHTVMKIIASLLVCVTQSSRLIRSFFNHSFTVCSNMPQSALWKIFIFINNTSLTRLTPQFAI
jgi:hypothetical protein